MKNLLPISILLLPPLADLNAAESSKPNILVMVSDDHGYADVGFQGCKDIPTPQLDQLARSGLRCTSGYVTHPFCSPTRAAMMTGRYQQRFGHENNPFYNPSDHREGLPLTEKLLPEFLRDAGYTTGWIGKWHLGAAPEFHPLKRGFTETFGFIGGGHRYQNWNVNPAEEYQVPIERNGRAVDVTDHLTVAFGHEAAAFIQRHKTQPWFLYLAFNAPHGPLEPTPERLARFASIADPKRRAYAAQVSLLDDAVGETLAALRSSGQENRTLVFFFSDNGGPIGLKGNGSSNSPLRAGKGSVYDGGIRVPFVVSWPGTLPEGRDYTLPVSSLDVFATSLALAGVPLPTDRPPDGVNLIPYLTGKKKEVPHDRLFWRTGCGTQLAIRENDMKLVRLHNGADELYDLSNDIGETKDLAGTRAKDVQSLTEKLENWNKTLVQPAFPGLSNKLDKSDKSGVSICGAVDANKVLVDFTKDRPAIIGTQATAQYKNMLELTFDARNGFGQLKAPEAGWALDASIAVAADIRNTGKTAVTFIGKLNHNIASSTLMHLDPGQSDTMVMYLFRKGSVKRFDSMNSAPGGDLRFWNGYDQMLIKDIQFCDLNGQAVGGTIAVKTIRAIGQYLDLKPAGDAFFPFVDRFGQYKHSNWPNKVGSVDDLKTLATKEAASLKANPRCADWSKFGGWAAGPKLPATGHFRTEKIKEQWCFVDPEGYLFWSIGADGVGFRSPTKVLGRERYFSSLPEAGLTKGSADFATSNMLLKYGPEWNKKAITLTHERLSSWAMNTCANWSDQEIYLARKTPYVVAVHLGEKKGPEALAIRGNENTLRNALKKALAKHAQSADDPWCIGYFIDNELDWKFVPDIDRYFRVVKEEMALAAPKKLNLGSRIHNGNRAALEASAKYCDVVSINCYEHSPVATPLDKPYIIGEFHFGSLDRGMLATGLRSASNQQQRANSYKHYMLEAIKRPNIVGAHWFTYREQALTGRGDGENYQVGLVDICDTPYNEMIDAIREIGSTLYQFRNEHHQ